MIAFFRNRFPLQIHIRMPAAGFGHGVFVSTTNRLRQGGFVYFTAVAVCVGCKAAHIIRVLLMQVAVVGNNRIGWIAAEVIAIIKFVERAAYITAIILKHYIFT